MSTHTSDVRMTEAAASIRVLVAEDDENARALLVDLLRELGHDVVAEVGTGEQALFRAGVRSELHGLVDVVGDAATVDEAVECVRTLDPDVVLLDVHMPGQSGIQAAEAIAHEVDEAAVVLLTGDSTLSLSDRDAAATSAIAFLAKPASPRVIDSTVRLAARRARDLMKPTCGRRAPTN